MDIAVGRKIALALDRTWYETVEKHCFLKRRSANADHPTDLIVAEVQSFEYPQGLWVRPDEKFSDFPKGSLFIPWQFIVAAVLLGQDDERKLFGLEDSKQAN